MKNPARIIGRMHSGGCISNRVAWARRRKGSVACTVTVPPACPCGPENGNHFRDAPHSGFTLIELLVVVAIIALLIAILVPSLSKARAQSKRSVCMSNLRQIGTSILAYANQNNDAIPRGPADQLPYHSQGWDQWATNQVWIGGMRKWQGVGQVMALDMTQPRVLFCPADESSDPVEELRKIQYEPDQDAFCSYLYRQRDETTRDKLDNLGTNVLGFKARALALDANSLGAGSLQRINHEETRLNILYLEGHVLQFQNKEHTFTLRETDYYGFPDSIERRLNEIVVAADYAERDDPTRTPPLP